MFPFFLSFRCPARGLLRPWLLALGLTLILPACESGEDLPWMTMDGGADAVAMSDDRGHVWTRPDASGASDFGRDFGTDAPGTADVDDPDHGGFDVDHDAPGQDIGSPDTPADATPDTELDLPIHVDADADADADVHKDVFDVADIKDSGPEVFSDAGDGLSCLQVVSCGMDCGSDQNCYNDCFSQGSPAAQDAAAMVLLCANQYCIDYMYDSNALMNCMFQFCSVELTQCFG